MRWYPIRGLSLVSKQVSRPNSSSPCVPHSYTVGGWESLKGWPVFPDGLHYYPVKTCQRKQSHGNDEDKTDGGSVGVFADVGIGLSFECGKAAKALARRSRGAFQRIYKKLIWRKKLSPPQKQQHTIYRLIWSLNSIQSTLQSFSPKAPQHWPSHPVFYGLWAP